MTPRLEIDLDAIENNTRTLTNTLTPRGIRVVGVTKGVAGSPHVAAAMMRGGAHGIADSRIDNLEALRRAGVGAPISLVRTPILSQVSRVVELADFSFNTELTVLQALSEAALAAHMKHRVVLVAELGDLRDGIPASDLVAVARAVLRLPGLTLAGIGANLACMSGVIPGDRNMGELSELACRIELSLGVALDTVSGGNSANLGWVSATADTGRVNELRLGEAILLGTDPVRGEPLPGLSPDVMSLVGEVIEIQTKPAQPWGDRLATTAFGPAPVGSTAGIVRQAIVAIGRQDAALESISAVDGYRLLGMSSDHLALDIGAAALSVGDEVRFHIGYSSLLRAVHSRSVDTQLLSGVAALHSGPTRVPA
ncbi:alanine racemase [Leucobacter luti]|uniref:alanine racemase n=1 Tax=Leucobacter luti TaxID=340320 RepID=UPI001C68BEB5|nr:alanine racemase [Leucobacter luti]QYM75101.1 alanine racemase [Leucobacter luti]